MPSNNAPAMSPIVGAGDHQIQLLPRVANVPHWISRPKDPRFNSGDIATVKFVDDGVNVDVVNLRRASTLEEDGIHFKDVVATRTSTILNHIADRAKEKGMAINEKKTALLCISAAKSFEPRVRVSVGQSTVTGQDKMKILGVQLMGTVRSLHMLRISGPS